jgi:hypothetical protein
MIKLSILEQVHLYHPQRLFPSNPDVATSTVCCKESGG